MKEPEDYGHWDGDVFVCHEPVEIFMSDSRTPKQVRKLDLTGIRLPRNVTRDDVVHAMLNSIQAQEMR